MKARYLFLAVVILAIALVHAAPMQISSPYYPCQSGSGGVSPVGNCAQYIVNVSRNRLGGNVVFIYQVNSGPVDVSGMDILTVANGPISGTAVQSYEPNSTQTMTLSVQEP